MVAVFSIPYLLEGFGQERFGVLTLIWAIIGYFSLFDFGVGRALTYELGRRENASVEEVGALIKLGVFLTLGAGSFGALLIAGIAFPLASSWLKISINLQQDAYHSFLIAALGVLPTTVTSGLRGALEGLNKFAPSNINKMFLGALMFGLPAASLFLHGDSLWMASCYIVAARVLAAAALVLQLSGSLRVRGAQIRTHEVRDLLSYGGWLTISGIVSPIMVIGDRFFVASVIGASQLPFYAVPQEALQRLLILPVAVCGALLPRFAALHRAEARALYQTSFNRVFVGMLVICCGVALFAYPAFSFWISKSFADEVILITVILSFGIWTNSLALVPFTLIHGIGHPKITALFHLGELALYLLLLWILTKQFGVLGAAMAWSLRASFDLLLLHFTAKYFLRSKAVVQQSAS